MKRAIKFDKDTPPEVYAELLTMPVRTIIYIVREDYETVMGRVDEACPTNRKFVLTPITPGTDLFTLYGEGHSIITTNEVTD